MMRKLTIATTLALALLATACASTTKSGETAPPPPPAADCPEPGSTTEPIDPEKCPEPVTEPEPAPNEPETCTSSPGDKRCPDENQ